MPTNPGETYLGDGLYASFDGEHIVLRAPRHPFDHIVYLDQQTFLALLRFMGQWGKEEGYRRWPACVIPSSRPS